MIREVIGVDIGKGQWTVVRATCDSQDNLGALRAELVPYERPIPLDDALAIIDIPIGLLDAAEANASPKGLSGVAVDNWLDALAMLVVAHDWATGARSMLATRDGLVQPWDGRRDRVLAIARSAHTAPVPKLTADRLIAIVTVNHRT